MEKFRKRTLVVKLLSSQLACRQLEEPDLESSPYMDFTGPGPDLGTWRCSAELCRWTRVRTCLVETRVGRSDLEAQPAPQDLPQPGQECVVRMGTGLLNLHSWAT